MAIMRTCGACLHNFSCNTCASGPGCWHNLCPTCGRLPAAERTAVAGAASARQSAWFAQAPGRSQ